MLAGRGEGGFGGVGEPGATADDALVGAAGPGVAAPFGGVAAEVVEAAFIGN